MLFHTPGANYICCDRLACGSNGLSVEEQTLAGCPGPGVTLFCPHKTSVIIIIQSNIKSVVVINHQMAPSSTEHTMTLDLVPWCRNVTNFSWWPRNLLLITLTSLITSQVMHLQMNTNTCGDQITIVLCGHYPCQLKSLTDNTVWPR